MPQLKRSKTSEQQREKWLRIRAHGKQRFILTRGILEWGISTFILVNLVLTLVDRSLHRPFAFPSLASLMTEVAVFCIFGYLYGLWFWNWHERNFNP